MGEAGNARAARARAGLAGRRRPADGVAMGNPVVGAARRLIRWDYKMDPRIAWLSPMPPAKTGIASYSQAVLDGLQRIGYRHAVRADLADAAEARGHDPVAHDGRLPPGQQRRVPPRRLPPRDPDAGARGDPRPGAGRLRARDDRGGRPARAPGDARGARERAEARVVPGRRPQRAAARPVRRARRAASAGHRGPLAVRRAVPARVRLPDAGLRGAAPGGRVRRGPAAGARATGGRARPARRDGDADAAWACSAT